MSRAICVPELLIQILEPLPLRGLISAMHVCQQWRSLVPRIDSPTRLRLLGLSFDDAKSPYPVSLDLRISYVEKIETTHSVVIPEPYRTILTEWPSSQPPPVLRLSRYHIHTPEATSDGDFVMILDGPTRGQIHAWASHDWYDGFEAEDFWTWNYSEWDAASTSQYYGVVEGFDSKSE
ncbi:hypothetical protein K438DRAFT_1988099 [Mycena galopus ATCC 62051]|nr:hypothetical protein K438DRAFT_1988099 [Mycena galopus ATCC 62051]